MAAMAVAVVAFSTLSEDVVERNGLSQDDPQLLHTIVAHRSPALVHAAKVLSHLGSAGFLAIAAVLAAGLLWYRGVKLVLALAPGLALGCAGVVTAAGKDLVARARPPLGLRIVAETAGSFPSGHSSDTTAMVLALALVAAVALVRRAAVRVLLVTGALGFAVLVGASRLELGVHWPTDVAAGWALGTLAAVAVVTAACLLAARARVADEPTAPGWRARARRCLLAERAATRERRALATTAAPHLA
jgi:membrane-associated phospholipid phosphatase